DGHVGGSFSDASGNSYSTDNELNGFWTPSGGSITPLADYGDLGFFVRQMVLSNNVVFIQDDRDSTWHTFNPSAPGFSNSLSGPALSGTVRATTSKSSGKACVEVTATTISNDWRVGFANSAFPF